MVHSIQSNWNAIYNEVLRWKSLLEMSPLIKYIPVSLGTSLDMNAGAELNG